MLFCALQFASVEKFSSPLARAIAETCEGHIVVCDSSLTRFFVRYEQFPAFSVFRSVSIDSRRQWKCRKLNSILKPSQVFSVIRRLANFLLVFSDAFISPKPRPQ